MSTRWAQGWGIDHRDSERPLLGWAFALFFAVLASYYTLRPLRETVGANLPGGQLSDVFTWVFVVMIVLVPAFGYVASSVPLRRVLPTVYGILIANLVGFSAVMQDGFGTRISWIFFIWVSVYNLFVVSLFWSLMTRCWSTDQGKRLFGVISAGGTLGSISGSLLAHNLVAWIGTAQLPLVSAAFLLLALVAGWRLEALAETAAAPTAEASRPPLTLAALVQGATSVALNPYLRRIAVFVFLANLVSTFFYLEQARLVKSAITHSQAQVSFFAGRDLMVSLATATLQMFGTARLLARLGLTVILAALPVLSIGGLLSIGAIPTLEVVAAVMVAERICAFALTGPAMRVLYTVVDPDEKYKAQNVIDTVVYRGGDAASGYVFAGLAAMSGLAAASVPLALLPVAALWLFASLGLGRSHDAQAAPKPGGTLTAIG